MSRRDLIRRGALGTGAVLLGAVAGGALLAEPASALFQDGWAYCFKCKALFFENSNGGRCPGGGAHDPTRSHYYYMNYNVEEDPFGFQSFWWHCKKCQLLHYSKFNAPGPCPAGGSHTLAGSNIYAVYWGTEVPPRLIQYGWAHCINCQGLHYEQQRPWSRCAGANGGAHSVEGSRFYAMSVNGYRPPPP